MAGDGWPGDDFDPGAPLTETSIHGRRQPYMTGCMGALAALAGIPILATIVVLAWIAHR